MRLENSFDVPASPDRAWALLMDVPRIIPCMPGAKLDETIDGESWKATVAVKLGPISLSFKTDVKREEVDEVARRAKLSARAREARGKGGATVTIDSSLTPLDGGTRIELVEWHGLVSNELRLHHESGRRVDGLDLVEHCGDRSLHERD